MTRTFLRGSRAQSVARWCAARTGGSFARVIYPFEELIRAKAEDLIWLKNDTHWNEIGAFVAYERLADELEKLMPIERVRRCDVESEGLDDDRGPRRKAGPAGSRLETACQGTRLPRASARRQSRLGGAAEKSCTSEKEHPAVALFSATRTPTRPFPSCANRSDGWYSDTVPHDFEVIMHERPRVVVNIMIERFLIRMPYDQPYRPLSALARERLKKGWVLPPPTGESIRIGHEWARELSE